MTLAALHMLPLFKLCLFSWGSKKKKEKGDGDGDGDGKGKGRASQNKKSKSKGLLQRRSSNR